MDLIGDRAVTIFGTKINNRLSLKKGETVTIQTGIIVDEVQLESDQENHVADQIYLALSAVDATNHNYQNYMIKLPI